MKIAYFSPVPPLGTGIADYSEELLPFLTKRAEIDVFIEDYEPSSAWIRDNLECYPARRFEELRAKRLYDLNLYQIGNSSFHRYALNAALRFPGVVVLHDLVLQHLFLGLSVEKGNVALYISEMKRAYGDRGAALGRQIAAALGSDLLASKFPLCERMVERSYGVLVLTRFMQRWLEHRFGAMPVGKFIGTAPHHYAPPPPIPVDDAQGARRSLGLQADGFLVAAFGLATRAKRIAQALEGFARFHAGRKNARFLIVGEVQDGFDLSTRIAALNISDKVEFTGRQPMDRFYMYMLAADVVLNLRFPSTGELSGTLIRALGMGKAVLVSNTGPFVEFPEHTVARIDLGPPEVPEIAKTLAWLYEQPQHRRDMGQYAKAYVESKYRLEDEADAYMAFLERVVEARRRGELADPPPFDQADLAASVMASITDMPLGRTFGLESVRQLLASAADPEVRE